MLIYILILTFIAFITILCLFLQKRLPFCPQGKHALVTGGSKGIGKSIAAELIQSGCKTITLIARDLKTLEKAAEELGKKCGPNQSIQIYSFDVNQGFEKTKEFIASIEESCGPIDLLINNAGICLQGGIDELPDSAFENQMRTNFFSAVNFTRAVLPQMKARQTGHIGFVSSAAGQIAIWGYSAYSPSKFAIRAFADVLKMELTPFGIGVSVLFPPNTATEGFDEELKNMSEETREISNSAGIFLPKDIASAYLYSIEKGEYWTCIGLDGQMLGILTAGSSGEPNPLKAILQILFGGIIRGIMLLYGAKFSRIIQKCHQKKLK